MTGYRNTPPHQRPTTPQRQDETRPRIEQTGAGRDWLDRVERIGRAGR